MRRFGNVLRPRPQRPQKKPTPLSRAGVFLWRSGRDSLGPSMALARWALSLRYSVQIGCPADLSNPLVYFSRVRARPVAKKKADPPLGGRRFLVAEWTGLEPATPGVTGRYSNQLNYHSVSWWVLTGSNRRPSPCKGDALPAELSTQSVRISRASTRLCEVCGLTAKSLQQRFRKTVLNQAIFRPPC